MPEESAAGEAGQEETRSASEGQEAFLVEMAPAKSWWPDRPPASRTLVRNEGGQTAEASLGCPAPAARWEQTPDEEPARLPVGEGRTTPKRELSAEEDCPEDSPPEDDALGIGARLPRPRGPRRSPRGRQLRLPEDGKRQTFTPQQRLLVLDTWRRSGLPAQDFASLVGTHPEWGCQRISDLLLRGPALPASASAVARVLHEAGYEAVQQTTHPHPDRVRRFERAKPNQLWQTDLFTFVLKRQNRRVYLVAFLDDHSRFVVCYGLHASQSASLVLEVLEVGLANYGPPEEMLTDNGAQYVTWRGKSRFTRRLEQRGIRQLVSRPQRPQTLGKIERFWGTLWRECLESAVFADLAEARRRIGHFLDYDNFQRPHRGAGGLVPADRFFQAAPTVLQTLKERVAANALELARYGQPKSPFYVTGQVAGQAFSVHAEGERLVLRREGQEREEIELTSPGNGSAGNSSPDRSSPATAGAVGDGPSPPPLLAEPLPAPGCPDGSPRPEQELVRLRRELDRSRRECQRPAALVRATQRALGFPAGTAPKPPNSKEPPAAAGGKRPPPRRATVRALRAAQCLRENLVWAGSGRRGTTIVRAGRHHGGDPASARCGSTVLAPVGRAITDGSSGVLA
jgi:transposase InsO family protein